MYSTEDEQELAIKKLQKASKIPRFVDTGSGTENEQELTIKKLQKPSKIHDKILRKHLQGQRTKNWLSHQKNSLPLAAPTSLHLA